MQGRYKIRSLLDFQKTFNTEEACLEHLAEQRWTLGFTCPRCNHDKCWFLVKRGLFDCKRCRYQSSITACTIFHKTRTSYRDKKGEERTGFAHMRVVDNASTEGIENFLERLSCGITTKEGKQLMRSIRSDRWKS
jgi:hypothetical protein